MARKEDLRFIRTNKKLYETFFELIKTQKMEELSITDICDAAGINRATFYKHFNDKKAFIMYCVAQKLRNLRIESRKTDTPFYSKMSESTLWEIFAFIRYIRDVNADNLDPNGNSIRLIYDSLMNFYFYEFVAYYEKGNYEDEYLDVRMRSAQSAGALLNMALYAMLNDEEALTEEACQQVIKARLK